MHELSLTHDIVAIACDAADGRRVRRVTLEIGRHTCVTPDSIRFCFDVVARGTLVDGALLDIRATDGDALIVTTLELEEAA